MTLIDIRTSLSNISKNQQSLKSIIANAGVIPVRTHQGIAGRLAVHAENWARITKDRWVLNTVRDTR